MADSTMLLLVLLLPVAGILLVSLPAGRDSALPRTLAMAVMLATLAFAFAIFNGYGGPGGSRTFAIAWSWIPSLGVNLAFGVDGLNVYLLLLSALLPPVVLAFAWNTREAASRLYLATILAIEAGLLGTFLSQNLMLFFVFWEAVLIPMVLLILVFGGADRRRAAWAFFMYTMVGSVLLLAAVILLGFEALRETGRWAFDFGTLYRLHLGWSTQLFVFAAVGIACAIKCPLFPLHSWLPLAYCEAPPSGTALMAGAMSKMGAFGLLKLALPLCPDVVQAAGPYVALAAVISILYGAVIALRQQDFRRLVAYSSLSHMGYIVLGVFSFQQTAIHGSLFQILSHGVAVTGLFMLLAVLEQRCGAGYLQLTSLSTRAPRLAVLAMLLVLASVALPMTSGFTAEFMILLGAFQQGFATWQAGRGALALVAVLLASTGMVIGAAYMLRFARRVLYGDVVAPLPAGDLSLREGVAFAPLLLLILWVGIWPSSLMGKAQGAASDAAKAKVSAMAPSAVASAAAVTIGVTNGN